MLQKASFRDWAWLNEGHSDNSSVVVAVAETSYQKSWGIHHDPQLFGQCSSHTLPAVAWGAGQDT